MPGLADISTDDLKAIKEGRYGDATTEGLQGYKAWASGGETATAEMSPDEAPFTPEERIRFKQAPTGMVEQTPKETPERTRYQANLESLRGETRKEARPYFTPPEQRRGEQAGYKTQPETLKRIRDAAMEVAGKNMDKFPGATKEQVARSLETQVMLGRPLGSTTDITPERATMEVAGLVGGGVKVAGSAAEKAFQFAGKKIAQYAPRPLRVVAGKAGSIIKAGAEKLASIAESGPARALKRSLTERASQAGETLDSAMEFARNVLSPLQEIHANSGFQRKAWQNVYDEAKPSIWDKEAWRYIKEGNGAKFLNGEKVAAPSPSAKKFLEAIQTIQGEVGAGGKEVLGTTLREDFGFTRNYLPEVEDALSSQKGPMWDAITNHLGTAKLEQLRTHLNSAKDVAAKTRLVGSLERSRLLDLPSELPVNGKMVKTYETDLTKVVPAYFEKGASRIEIGKMADKIRSGLPEKEWMPDDVEQIGLHLKQGMTKAEQGHVDTILKNIQGEPSGMGRAWNKFAETKVGKAYHAVESVISAKVLSGAGMSNTVASWPLVQSEIGRIAGMKAAAGTPKAFARSALPSWLFGKTAGAQMAEDLNAITRKLSTAGNIETSHINSVSRAVLDHGTLLGYGNKMADEAGATLISDAMKVIGKDEKLLRRFGQDYHLTDAMIAEVKNGNISKKTMYNIMDNFVNRVNPRAGSPLDLSFWHNDPLYKRMFPFLTYARAGGNIAADVTRAATEHGNWKPATLFIASIYGGAVAETFVKDLATGKIEDEDLGNVMKKAVMRVPLGAIVSELQDLGYSIGKKRDLDMSPVVPIEVFRTIKAARGTETKEPDYAYPVRTSFPGKVIQNVTGEDWGPDKYSKESPEGRALHKKRSESSRRAALKRKYGR